MRVSALPSPRIAPAYAAKCSRGPVLVLPGYLRDCTEYAPLVAELRARGFEAWAAPIRWYHWAPTVGGRSMRPILDRIHHAVTHLAHGIDHLDYETTTTTPEAPYGTVQFLQELGDASQGSAVPQLQHVSMRDAALGSMAPTPVRRVALVGHSASGWVSRLYLGASKPYGNRVYPGASLVHTLCMLGSPQYTSEGITSRNLAFVNDHAPLHAGVKCVVGISPCCCWVSPLVVAFTDHTWLLLQVRCGCVGSSRRPCLWPGQYFAGFCLPVV